MPYTAPLQLITEQQQQQLDQSLHRQQQWPGKRVTITNTKRNDIVAGIRGSSGKAASLAGFDQSNSYPLQIPNSSSLSRGSPMADFNTAIINSLKSASPPTRRASYSSSPSRPSPLQLNTQDSVHLLPRTLSSCNLSSIPMLRKKSGEVVKPSLKRSAKSAPTTPTCPKYVHFDTQLEHVRLFLQAETPDAVKEDAEPVEDRASELTLALPNWPTPSVMSNQTRMVSVESIAFADDTKKTLNGRINVQNIAFHKTVTVRYTFDYWQSVHESQATYRDSIKDKVSFDRFTFQISLLGKVGSGLAPEDEQRTMYFAVRYNVQGREFWDNNNGMNYQVEFKRTTVLPKSKIAAGSWSESKPDPKDQQKLDILSSSPLSSSPSNEILPLKKKPNNRYDIGITLSATKKVAASPAAASSCTSTSSSVSAFGGSVRLNQNWPTLYPGVTTASSIVDGYNSSTSFGFPDEYLSASLAEPLMNTWDGMRDFSYGPSQTTPISIPKTTRRPPSESTGYFDLVNKYCFYGGNTSPYSSSPYSNSPPVIG